MIPIRPCLASLAFIGLAACQEEHLDSAAVDRGKTLSTSCTACHQLTTSVHQIGPGLKDIIGSTAGMQAGFDYSPGLKASGIVWTPETLIAFLQDPLAMVPDTKMAIGELNPAEATDLVTYLRSLD